MSIAGALVGNGNVEAYFFDLNGEQTLPAAFSGTLLFLAEGLDSLLRLVLAFLSLNDIGALHEKIQSREAIDIHPGRIVLLPLVIAAGLKWIVALRRSRASRAGRVDRGRGPMGALASGRRDAAAEQARLVGGARGGARGGGLRAVRARP